MTTAALALALDTPAAAPLALDDAPPPDRDPVAVYLARLDAGTSRRTMAAALATIATELGAPSPHVLPWGALRYPHVIALRARLAERLAPATTNKILCALRGVAREAMRLGLLAADEYTRIADVEGVRGSRLLAGRHVEGVELAAHFAACDDAGAIGVRDAALLAVLRVAGLRRAELASLLLGDLDRGAWTLRVLGKGGRERRAFVTQARPELEAWLRLRGEAPGPLFCAVRRGGHPTLTPMDESSIRYVLDRSAERARVPRSSPHDWRRTFVGDLLDAGADLATVQRLAGHAQPTTTQRYDRRSERAAARAAALLHVPRRS